MAPSFPTPAPLAPRPVKGELVVDLERSLEEFYESTYAPGYLYLRAEHTLHQYHVAMRHLNRMLGRPATIGDLNAATFRAFQAYLIRVRGLENVSANKTMAKLACLWKWAAMYQHVETWPDWRRLPEAKRHPTAFTFNQVQRLVDTMATLPNDVAGIPASLWWTSVVLLIYDCGLRIGAVLQLSKVDVDLETQRLIVPPEVQKCGNEQCFPLSAQLTALLKGVIEAGDSELLFPTHFFRGDLYRRFKVILKRAGLPNDRRSKFHRLRRTSGTMAELYVGPGAAQRHLGHTCAEVTERYIDRSLLPSENLAAKLPRPVVAALPGVTLPEQKPVDAETLNTSTMVGPWPDGALQDATPERTAMPEAPEPKKVAGGPVKLLRTDGKPDQRRKPKRPWSHPFRDESRLFRFLEERFVVERLVGRPKSARQSYESAIRSIEQFAGKPLSPFDLTDDLIRSHLHAMRVREASKGYIRQQKKLLRNLRHHAQLPAVVEAKGGAA